MDTQQVLENRAPASADQGFFSDGLGRRTRSVDASGQTIETFRLCQELSAAETTEAALVERAARLVSFDHPSFAAVSRVERHRGALGGLAIVSHAVPGIRLAELLRQGQRRWIEPDLEAAGFLLKRVTDGIAALHQHGRDVAHGALGPQTIVVRPDGKPVIVEHILGPAIERRQLSRTRLWTQFRLPAPPGAGAVRLDQLTDVVQVGVLALALVIGRPLRREEFPHRVADLLAEASVRDPLATRAAMPRALRLWIGRALQFENRTSFRNGMEAAAAFESALAEEAALRAVPTAVIRYMEACTADTGLPVRAGPSASDPAPQPIAAAVVSVITRPRPDRDPWETAQTAPPTGTDAPVPGPSPADREAAAAPAERPAIRSPRWRDALRKVRETFEEGADRPLAPGARLRPRGSQSAHRNLARQLLRVAAVAVSLVALFGVTYLGARGYLGIPGLGVRKGTLVVDSRPSGAEVYVDGTPDGRTPVTLELAAGQHTLTLKTPKSMTLVPVIVVAGARRTERVELGPARRPFRSPLPRTSLPGPRDSR